MERIRQGTRAWRHDRPRRELCPFFQNVTRRVEGIVKERLPPTTFGSQTGLIIVARHGPHGSFWYGRRAPFRQRHVHARLRRGKATHKRTRCVFCHDDCVQARTAGLKSTDEADPVRAPESGERRKGRFQDHGAFAVSFVVNTRWIPARAKEPGNRGGMLFQFGPQKLHVSIGFCLGRRVRAFVRLCLGP